LNPLEALLVRCFRETGPRNQHVVLPTSHLRQQRAPRLAQLALDPITNDRRTARLRNGEPEPRLVAAVFAREPIEDEKPRRHGAPLPVDGIEVARAAEPVLALHDLRRKALPALGAATLEDRTAGARRHAGTKAVPPLSAPHVGLVGPLQGECKEGEKSAGERLAARQYRRALSTGLSTGGRAQAAAHGTTACKRIHTCGGRCGCGESPVNLEPLRARSTHPMLGTRPIRSQGSGRSGWRAKSS